MNNVMWDRVWNDLGEKARAKLVKLLLADKRMESINFARAGSCLGVIEAKNFIDSPWLLKKLGEFNPIMMTPKEKFKAEVLRIVTDILKTINDPEMLALTKYNILTEADVPKLFDLCMED